MSVWNWASESAPPRHHKALWCSAGNALTLDPSATVSCSITVIQNGRSGHPWRQSESASRLRASSGQSGNFNSRSTALNQGSLRTGSRNGSGFSQVRPESRTRTAVANHSRDLAAFPHHAHKSRRIDKPRGPRARLAASRARPLHPHADRACGTPTRGTVDSSHCQHHAPALLRTKIGTLIVAQPVAGETTPCAVMAMADAKTAVVADLSAIHSQKTQGEATRQFGARNMVPDDRSRSAPGVFCPLAAD